MFQMLLLLCVPQVGFCTCLNKGRQFGKHGYGTDLNKLYALTKNLNSEHVDLLGGLNQGPHTHEAHVLTP